MSRKITHMLTTNPKMRMPCSGPHCMETGTHTAKYRRTLTLHQMRHPSHSHQHTFFSHGFHDYPIPYERYYCDKHAEGFAQRFHLPWPASPPTDPEPILCPIIKVHVRCDLHHCRITLTSEDEGLTWTGVHKLANGETCPGALAWKVQGSTVLPAYKLPKPPPDPNAEHVYPQCRWPKAF